jgi:hypothetical protein
VEGRESEEGREGEDGRKASLVFGENEKWILD